MIWLPNGRLEEDQAKRVFFIMKYIFVGNSIFVGLIIVFELLL